MPLRTTEYDYVRQILSHVRIALEAEDTKEDTKEWIIEAYKNIELTQRFISTKTTTYSKKELLDLWGHRLNLGCERMKRKYDAEEISDKMTDILGNFINDLEEYVKDGADAEDEDQILAIQDAFNLLIEISDRDNPYFRDVVMKELDPILEKLLYRIGIIILNGKSAGECEWI